MDHVQASRPLARTPPRQIHRSRLCIRSLYLIHTMAGRPSHLSDAGLDISSDGVSWYHCITVFYLTSSRICPLQHVLRRSKSSGRFRIWWRFGNLGRGLSQTCHTSQCLVHDLYLHPRAVQVSFRVAAQSLRRKTGLIGVYFIWTYQ